MVLELERRVDGRCALGEQGHGGGAGPVPAGRQRRNPDDPLAGHPHRDLAGGEHAETVDGAEQARDRPRRPRQLFEVVEDDEHRLVAELGRDRIDGALGSSQHSGDLGGEQVVVRDRCELDKPDAAAEPIDDVGGDAQGQPRLADAARPEQRHEAVRLEQVGNGRRFGVAAEECRQLHREVVAAQPAGPQRGKGPG